MKLKDIPLDDDKTWDLICSCDTAGIFQMESDVGKGVIRQVKPRNMEELSAVNAFVRPGTSGLENYCEAKIDPTRIVKYHPIIDKILAPTYGGIIYQETIMSLIAKMMDISFGKADIYRRALEKPNKKGNVELVEEFKKECVPRAVKIGVSKEAAEKIQQAILDNAGYLFNKSHSVAYSFISYWTAWIKANYPLVFYVSLFNTEPIEKLQSCIQEAVKHGIVIAPPDMSKSKFESTIEDKDKMVIRMGLNCVKGIGEKAVNDITPQQPFTDFADYFARAGKGSGKTVVECGIKIGAFSNIPIKVSKSLFDKQYDNIKTVDNADDTVNIFLTTQQQFLWYTKYLEVKAKKSIPNYAIPNEIIKGKYMNNFSEDDLVKENDGTIIIPETELDKFGLDENSVVEYKTRKKPKGIFKNIKTVLSSAEERALKMALDELNNLHQNNVQQYLNNMTDFSISFIPHPLEKASSLIPILDKVKDDTMVRTAGIIVDIIKKVTKTGKDFYNVILQTPLEKQKLTVWNNVFLKYQKILEVNHIVKAYGKKGFGGITVQDFVDAKSNYT
nr:MAG TPA: DNA polymerase III, alpha subunit [Caudoviricetes sp.]